MTLFGGIDLHSNNAVIILIDDLDKEILRKKIPCDIDMALNILADFKDDIAGLAVESTFNWYWLVDGLMDANYSVYLVNTAAVKQYEGLKHADDNSDAFWLAHLLRLGILPTGYIYPKETRSLRDLLRKRSQLVQLRTTNILSIQNLYIRNTGAKISSNAIKKLTSDDIQKRFDDENIALAINSNRTIIEVIDQQVIRLENTVLDQAKQDKRYSLLLSIYGIGKILGLTIMLETGEISRFAKVGNFTSYCRCVDSIHTSNGKKKGKGNTKNGNKYLSWAFIEAANFAIRFHEPAKHYYQRKMAKSKRVIALKAVAHKLARASYYVMRDQVPFDPNKLFG